MNALAALLLLFLPPLHAFAPQRGARAPAVSLRSAPLGQPSLSSATCLHMINQKRRKELGLGDEDREYDLDVALSNNTDAGITKIIAGSFILVMIALLVVGLVIPSITDYGEGVCSPIQNGGRC
ncbi:hypothetical protein ACHAXT_009284 [Thalassiosira profunda]